MLSKLAVTSFHWPTTGLAGSMTLPLRSSMVCATSKGTRSTVWAESLSWLCNLFPLSRFLAQTRSQCLVLSSGRTSLQQNHCCPLHLWQCQPSTGFLQRLHTLTLKETNFLAGVKVSVGFLPLASLVSTNEVCLRLVQSMALGQFPS